MHLSGESMEPSAITDRDWRLFVELRERARERFASQTLARCQLLCDGPEASAPERQRKLLALVDERRHEMSALFDDFRRSTATLRLYMMVRQGLLDRHELDDLSLPVRRRAGVVEY